VWPKKIIVVGCGLGGLTFALAMDAECKRAGISAPAIEILERAADRSQKQQDSYCITLQKNSGAIAALDSIGLGPILRALMHLPITSTFWASSSGAGVTRVLTRASFTTETVPWRRVRRLDLWSMLLDRVLHLPNVTVNWSSDVVDITGAVDAAPAILAVRTRDGRSIHGDLCIAADGNRSRLRQVGVCKPP
jgi:2-polyprenyl-6-methoxyphenol hydroxylase-like FAD-dependent oxidoreductase